jgi:hypothetical protein
MAPRISMVNGCHRCRSRADRKCAVRLQVDPTKLQAEQIGLKEIIQGHPVRATDERRRLPADRWWGTATARRFVPTVARLRRHARSRNRVDATACCLIICEWSLSPGSRVRAALPYARCADLMSPLGLPRSAWPINVITPTSDAIPPTNRERHSPSGIGFFARTGCGEPHVYCGP